ncbi:hypothetical protein PUNSTDRAFT_70465 [Punctularia strigosozonata HHB-11173 SS5]|uniref:uncharacterized protein n=1 Tax=Punctularia strigosozonata (strain HHB-11173) TaxID=741275 RepID=UPI000441672F|nr:uncharacterized protein PUNSTDRAFT_70465 [Punctularia strigosozonata HHB-11173 SS5]EIN07588.1 hypothetical protein PUNSTDRAFT_70465 [Punctularia strigosozonata HHB-11173 SS5]
MDLRFRHPTTVHRVRACLADDAHDLVAVAGEHSVDVIQVADTGFTQIASFHIGTSVTALAWSPRTVSPSRSDRWLLEIAVASADFGLHLLTKSPEDDEHVFPFGGGLSGHHGKVTDMAFCGGTGEDAWRYVATVSDDRMMMVWDLYPNVDIGSTSGGSQDDGWSPPPRRQPTALVINFAHPLTSISAHPSSNKEFLVADCRGSIFVTDWRRDPYAEDGPEPWRGASVVELVEPRALANTAQPSPDGSVAWHRSSAEFVGAAFGPTFAIYDLSALNGGKPTASGTAFPEGAGQFRWCPTFPDYFAISSSPASAKGATIHLYNTQYVHTPPSALSVAPRPHKIRDFDFLALPGIPRIAAAVGREVIIFPIGME